MRSKNSTRKSHLSFLSRVGLKTTILSAGILALLVWSLSSSAGTFPRLSKSTPKAPSTKSVANAPGAKLEPAPLMPAFFKASGNLDQVRNGTAAAPIDPPDWVNGNAGASNAHYREGESIPYRLYLTGLSVGAHTVFIEWDTRHSSVNAIDYITYYDRIGETVNPLLGLPGAWAAPVSTLIPTPGITNGATIATNSFLALPTSDKNFTSYNASNLNLSYDHENALTGAQTASGLKIDFNATAANVLFTWGGHIASRGDWGAGNSASGISGSPYHTRFISLDGSGGNQDRSLSAAAVSPPQGCTLSNDTPDVCDIGTKVTHTASAVAGQTYSFSLVNSGGSNASIVPTPDTDPAGGTVSAQVQTSGAGSYTLTLTTTTGGGTETCSVTVNVHQPPAADAGDTAYEHCQTDGFAFAMTGATSTVPTGGTRKWTVSPAGAASISDDTAAQPTITLSGVGSVTATLTVTGPSCNQAQDSSTLTVSATASANAGNDAAVCASSPSVTLNGSIGGSALTAAWSGGTGNFSPNNTTLNASYTPSAAEITAGSVTLTLTTNDPTGSCNAAADSMTITIRANPTVAISMADACAATAHLHATVTGATGTTKYTWTKDGQSIVNNSADLTLTGPGTYAVSVEDNQAGTTKCGGSASFKVCYNTQDQTAAQLQVNPNPINVATKPKAEGLPLATRLALFIVSKLGFVI
jgi:hypothetical protein